jgi:gliding motility-associated-like protein
MKKLKNNLLLFFFLLTFSHTSLACSPCAALSNITQTITGSNLDLTFTSNAGWQCCYTVQIEIVCSNANFTGIANYFSPEICINGGSAASSTWATPVPYPTTTIDLSSFCPGTYKWRAKETSCNILTPEFQFTVDGQSPILVEMNLTQDTICLNDNTQFSVTAANGCNAGSFNYSWSPATGLSNASIANPIASPSTTTNYVVTVTEIGSCTAPQTSNLTVTVNPLPTATIAGTIAVCEDASSPALTFEGQSSTGPYTIAYSLNGVAQTPIVAANTNTVQFPTNIPGTYTFSLLSVQDGSSVQCLNSQTGDAVITINPLPVVSAGLDQILCEPNDVTPSEVTLNGSGAISYTWDNNAANGVAFTPPSGTTTYTVIGTDANGCTDSDLMTVTALIIPIANASASDTYGNVPMTITYSNLSQFATTYSWDLGNNSSLDVDNLYSVSTDYTIPGIYTITLIASNGICFDTWTAQVEVLPSMVVTPPNVFTPNNDNSNELYFVDVKYGEKFQAIIMNRWGEVVHELDAINQGWDGKYNGKELTEGVYFIHYTATDFNLNENTGQTYFHLIR